MIPVQEIREFQDRNEGTLVTSWLGLLLAVVERVSAERDAEVLRHIRDLAAVIAERDVWMRRATVADAMFEEIVKDCGHHCLDDWINYKASRD